MRPFVLAAVLALSLLAAALAARAQPPPPDPVICNASLRDWGGLAASSDYQAMERLLARTPNACRQLRAQIQARVTALRPAPAADACETAQTRWASLRTSTNRDALQGFVTDTPTRCAIREAAVQRLASWPASTARPPATTTSTTWRAGQEFDDCSGAGWCPRMLVIPSGSFMMGSPDNEAGRDSDEGPQRRVSIRQFAVGKFEVTWDQWMACVNRGGCSAYTPNDQGYGRGTRPVTNVTWENARDYVLWLSRKTGRSYRLLSEAEWEYAARAGTDTQYPWGYTASYEYANYGADTCCSGLASGRDQWVNTSPAGSFPANAFGLFDMHGNVWEWVQDCYAASYSGLPTDGSANETSCSIRVYRGGSWNDYPQFLRSAIRVGSRPRVRVDDVGFRVARTLN